MKPFEYFAPATLEEAVEIMARYDEGVYPVAGGTDLLPKMRYGQITPKVVVNLKRIPGLNEITPQEDGGLRIGALATLTQTAQSPYVRKNYPMVAQIAGKMASVPIRNLATVGGNLCNAAPSADLAPPLIALDAEAVIFGPQGERRVLLEAFFTGPGTTVLERGELLTAVIVPPPDPHARGTYIKHAYREALDIAVVGVAALVRWDSRGSICRDARIVLGAVAPTPIRAREAEAVLRDAPLTDDRITEAGRLAAQAARPIDDVRGSAWYRRQLVEVLTRRALRSVISNQ